MSWFLVGTTIVGGVAAADATNSAADAGTDATLAGIQSNERMYNQALQLEQPYRQHGYEALDSLAGLTTADGRTQMLTDYYNSDEFRLMQDQAEEATLRNASVVGGVRSGAAYSELEGHAANLGLNYLASQENTLTNIANMGRGAATSGANNAMSHGNTVSGLQQQVGAYQGNQALNQAQIFNSAAGTLGGISYWNSKS